MVKFRHEVNTYADANVPGDWIEVGGELEPEPARRTIKPHRKIWRSVGCRQYPWTVMNGNFYS